MAKSIKKTKETPETLKNGAKKADKKVIEKILIETAKNELTAFNEPKDAIEWLSKFIEKYFDEVSKQNKKPGEQLKLLPTNRQDDLIQVLNSSQSTADKFYSKRTLKSSVALRKTFLDISKTCLEARKEIL